jgi:hypothetical protein
MNKGIPFIKVADRVEVTVDLKGKRVDKCGCASHRFAASAIPPQSLRASS